MLEQRNLFINNMNNSISSQKNRFQNILNKLGWTLQSVSGYVKEEDCERTNSEQQNYNESPEVNIKHCTSDSVSEGKTSDFSDSLINIEGTSTDSDKRYNELLASLSFQPKVKKEKMSDTQLLASLLESERNAKRRRISYRNKVHTKNKSQTEVLREVIREQMEILKNEEEENKESECPNKNENEDDEMLEVNVLDGNPHLAWQTVGSIVEDQLSAKEKHREHYQSDNRHTTKSRHTSPDHRHRKHRHSKREEELLLHSPKYRKNSSPNRRDRSPKHRKHKKSHSRRSSSQERYKKSSDKHSRQYSNRKHLDR